MLILLLVKIEVLRSRRSKLHLRGLVDLIVGRHQFPTIMPSSMFLILILWLFISISVLNCRSIIFVNIAIVIAELNELLCGLKFRCHMDGYRWLLLLLLIVLIFEFLGALRCKIVNRVELGAHHTVWHDATALFDQTGWREVLVVQPWDVDLLRA